MNYTQLKKELVTWKIAEKKSSKMKHREQGLGNAHESLREGTLGKSYTYIIGVIQGKEKEAETTFVMPENFPEIKGIKPQILEG